MKFLIQLVIPSLLTLVLLLGGVSELILMSIAWIALGIGLFLTGLFSICFYGLKLENSPIGRAIWPVMVTDIVLFNRYNSMAVISSMLLVSLLVSAPLTFPVFFGLSTLATCYFMMDYAAGIYGPLIATVEEKHGEDTYKDDDR